MELFKAFVTILARDEASSEVEDISNNIMGKLAGAAKTAAKALATLWAGNQVVQFGKDAFFAYSQFEQLEGGVAKLYGNASHSVEEYAASVGQSVDEAQAAFDRNERAQAMVMANAQQAWKTAGMNANQYMQTATSFSASLINSLGGDTEEAARLTNEAMVAMSDNVNTFGSDMQSVQNAFQGFAKQNYTMLDNLKLGYGGTKTEMERLIKDASQMTKEQEDLNMTVDAGSMSFDNIVKAIQVVQKHQGIYGTTTKEALHTIEGSMNATKAAWQNLVAELGKPDADLNARVADLATAIFGEFDEELGRKSGGLFENVKNEVLTVASNMGNALVNGLRTAFDLVIENAPKMALNMVKGISKALGDAASNLKSFNLSGGPIDFVSMLFGSGGISEKLGQMLGDIGEIIREWSPDIAEGFMSLMREAGNTISNYGPTLISYMAQAVGGMATSVVEHIPEVVNGFVNGLSEVVAGIGGIVASIGSALVEAWPYVTEAFGGLVEALPNVITETVPNILEKVGELVTFLATAIVEHGPEVVESALEVAEGMLSSVAESITSHGPEVVQKVVDIVTDILNWLIDNGPAMLSAALTLFSNIGKAIAQHAPGILNSIARIIGLVIGYVIGAVGRMLAAGLQFVGGLLTGAQNKGGEVLSWFGRLPSMIVSALGSVGSILWSAGSSLIGGLLEGMKSAASGVFSWVSTIADKIASLKGPLPYDRKVLIPNGLALMDSLYSGIRKGFENEVVPYISGMAFDMRDALGSPSFNVATSGVGAGGVVYNLYVDGTKLADAQLQEALGTVANRVYSMRRMGAIA